MSNESVIYTGAIPRCPHCKKPTTRQDLGVSSTRMYFSPIYDENGVNVNPDRNTITHAYKCNKCGQTYSVKGNQVDGFRYYI